MLSYAEAVYYMLNGESGDSSGTSKPKQLKITDRWTDTITPPQDHPNRWWDRVQVNVPKSTATLKKNHEKVEPEGKYKGFSQVSVAIPMHASETFTRNLKSYTFENYKTRDTNPYPEDEAGWMQVQARPSVLHQFQNAITENGTYTPPFSYTEIMDPDGAYDGVKNAVINVYQGQHTQQEIEEHQQYLEQIEAQIAYYSDPDNCKAPVDPQPDTVKTEFDTSVPEEPTGPTFPDIIAAFPEKILEYGDLSWSLLLFTNEPGTSAPIMHTVYLPSGGTSRGYVVSYIKWYENGVWTDYDKIHYDTNSAMAYKDSYGVNHYPYQIFKDFKPEIFSNGSTKMMRIKYKCYFQGWQSGYGTNQWIGFPTKPENIASSWEQFEVIQAFPRYYRTTWKVKT
jgi:hypothetical protein